MGQEAAEGIDPDDPTRGWQIMIDQSANGAGRPSRGGRRQSESGCCLDAPEHVSGIVVPG